MLRQNFSTHSLPPVSNVLLNYRRGNSTVKLIPSTSPFLTRANSGNVVNVGSNNVNGEEASVSIQRLIPNTSCLNNNHSDVENTTGFETDVLSINSKPQIFIKAQPGNVPLSDSDEELNSEVDEDEEEDQPGARWALV